MKRLKSYKSTRQKINFNSYAGNWVAFIDEQPVTYASTLSTLMQKVKKYRLPKEPSVMLIPRKDEGPYVLILL
ncbi:MAG: DUF5678 domain-containing protein [Candidatus Hydrogenedentota bacterium]